MKIAELKLGVLMDHVMQVYESIGKMEGCSRLLNEAADDTPIIRELMAELAILHNSDESDPAVERGLAAAHRDLVLLLALRAIEQESMMPGSVSKAPAGNRRRRVRDSVK